MSEYLKKELGDNIFNDINREEDAMNKALQYISWRLDNNRVPSKHSKDLIEKSLGLWFSRYKGIINNKKIEGKNYEAVTELLKKELGEHVFNLKGSTE